MRGSHPSKGGLVGPVENGPISMPTAGEVIDRMQEAVGVSTDVALSEELGLARKTTNNWRAREYKPLDFCLELAVQRGLSLDWLVLGQGEPLRGAPPAVADDGTPVPHAHVALQRLRAFDMAPGPDQLILPDLVVRRRVADGDVSALRWMVNPTDALAPRLPQGGVLLVDTSVSRHEDVVDGETYVVQMWGRINVRRIFIIGPNEYRLRGDSELEERRDLTGPDYQHLTIGGRVIGAI
ncbi:LexA family transcriptional regulator [Luteibacter sp. NPDC031894]|uniref:LexA family transcriptional regulator n=1 Tax=Luteibacter sp. NPDC031894 TaxID=3390572 RepID=UPI003CFCC23D